MAQLQKRVLCHCGNPLNFAKNRFTAGHNYTLRKSLNQVPSQMSCWQTYEYGGADKLRLSQSARTPVLRGPRDILVKVHAASINPIDTKALAGYGSILMNAARRLQHQEWGDYSEFPLVLGRDFSGVVVQTGQLVPPKLCSVGDEVSSKPSSVNHTDSASLPYVATTTWAALTCPPNTFTSDNTPGTRTLILGAGGGIGTFAIQLLKAWGGHVTAVCGTSSLETILSLGADVALDYNVHDVKEELKHTESFDLVFDLVGKGQYDYTVDYLHEYGCATYVSLVHPILANGDELGIPLGLLKSACELGMESTKNLSKGRLFKWGLYRPSRECLTQVAQLVDAGKILPSVSQVFDFDDLPSAYEQVSQGHNKGKVVVEM